MIRTITLAASVALTILICACNSVDPGSSKKGSSFIPGPLSEGMLETDTSTFLRWTMGGKGDTTLLFIHGWCINRTFWEYQLKEFSSEYQVLAPDMAGTGGSTSMRNIWTMNVLANDLELILDHLGESKLVIVGHAIGADLMLMLAKRRPEQVIACIGVEAFKDINYELTPEDIAHRTTAIMELYKLPAIMGPIIARESFYSRFEEEEFREKTIHTIRLCDGYIGPRIFNIYIHHADAAKENLAALEKPLYLLNSEYTETDTLSIREVTDQWKGMWTFPFEGHFPMLENPLEFNKALSEALELIRDQKK